MSKYLITSGCSFSEIHSSHFKSWPKHLVESLDSYNLISKGLASQGNGLISRGIIYEVSKKLKDGVPAKDILVGVQWSGPDRMDFLFDDSQFAKHNLARDAGMFDKNKATNWDGWMENPTGFIDDDKNWVIAGHVNWKLGRDYFKKWHSKDQGSIYTLENVLRVQWFLEKHNIKYFMTTMTSDVLDKNPSLRISHLYEQIDFTRFLPINGMMEFAQKHTTESAPMHLDGVHPGPKHYKILVEEIILPFLETEDYPELRKMSVFSDK
tara:strand:- start:973 stop:1770 length:798 start_codon:yes stop_codon:yes gene_type:complete